MATSQANRLTFDQAAERYLAAKRPEFRNRKHATQWLTSLQTHASPVQGALPLSDMCVGIRC